MIGKPIIMLDEVDSTNNYAKGLFGYKESEEGAVVLARAQTSGRGQQANSWESEPNKNLTFSIIFRPVFLEPARQFILSEVVSLGISDFVSAEVGGAKIKWPNDIYAGNKKICGILIENSIAGNQLSVSVAGIGLNINQEKFISNAPNPVSLKQITGKEYNLMDCLERATGFISEWYDLLKAGQIKIIGETYHNRLYRMGEWAKYSDSAGIFTGRILRTDEFGRLIIEKENAEQCLYNFKEVGYL